MSQVSKYPISKQVYERIFELLVKIFSKSYSEQEALDLLEDIFTPIERIMIAKRLAIAVLLYKKYSYQQIQDILCVSKITISNVSVAMKYKGQGYKKFAERVYKEEKMKDFWDKITLVTIKNLAKVKGSSVWYYLDKELERKRKRKTLI